MVSFLNYRTTASAVRSGLVISRRKTRFTTRLALYRPALGYLVPAVLCPETANVFRAIQSDCQTRMVIAVPVARSRRGSGLRHRLDLEIQSRTPQHDVGRNHPNIATSRGCLARYFWQHRKTGGLPYDLLVRAGLFFFVLRSEGGRTLPESEQAQGLKRRSMVIVQSLDDHR